MNAAAPGMNRPTLDIAQEKWQNQDGPPSKTSIEYVLAASLAKTLYEVYEAVYDFVPRLLPKIATALAAWDSYVTTESEHRSCKTGSDERQEREND